MKKFVFNLELVLTLRKKEEEKVAQELAAAQVRYRRILDEITGTENQIGYYYGSLKTMYLTSIDINAINNTKAYIEKLKNYKIELEEKAKKAHLEVEAVNKRLLEAIKNRKIIEKHKENELEKYKLEAAKAENIFIDEISSNMKMPHL